MGKDSSSEYESSEGEEAKHSSSSASSEEEQEETENSKTKMKITEEGNRKNRDNGTTKSNEEEKDCVSRKRSYKKDNDEEEEEERPRAKRAAKAGKDVLFRVVLQSNEIGRVIGKQGATIKQLREDTGARIKIADPVTPVEDRVIIITSKAEENEGESAAEFALIRIAKVILEGNEGTISKTKSSSRHVGPNMIRLLIADSQAGSLIGISGTTIKEIRKESGASVHIMARNQLPMCASASETDRLVQISGEVSQVLKALEHIGATLRENPPKEVVSMRPAYYLAPGAANRMMLLPQSLLSPGNHNSPYSRGGRRGEELGGSSLPKVSKEINIPSYVVGALIGRGGSNITEIRSRSGATVKITGEKDTGTRIVYIEGTTQQVDIAQNLIDSYIDVES